ncbi:glucose 1-dehydrogenase [Pseudomonas sp. TH41]|jgi:NAD(P)-dependent dehydrogenase (short-subunit alcohol dehydrogenase family)|uniref:SDR family NAD(P)-dependent oxidoreductase n=1 Tax=Pseudomonas sp. TH41 TaxID=2796405 RepID=UPI001912166F|nr:glucose 1-dehydrogenase [Pseudomonas sp. TH41]MBK5355796.1 glucose 1-dehydrogenase [Pseudomonas sp. TH41]
MKEAAITSPSLSAAQDLKGKTIIVTGAGSGIGRESAIIFSLAGANVIVSDITAESAKATVDSIHSRGGIATFVKADLSVEAEVQLLVSAAVETYGRLDGAFNNAGIGQVGKPLHELSTQEWQRALLVDLTSVFWCMKYQILAMMTTGGGAIVNTASALGQVAIPHAGEYVAAKHGVIGITRAAAADYGAKGVRVNCVLPGIIKTPLIDELSTDPRFASSLEKLLERHPIGRFGNPSEIGEAARWLLSDAASFVNGSAIAVDGGYLAV